MTKRTLLYWIALNVVVLTYLVTAGADADVGSISECVGLASLPHWLDSDCKAALSLRLLILATGAVPTFILTYFAEKGQLARGARKRRHDAWVEDEPGKSLMYWCHDCDFESDRIDKARAHADGRRDSAVGHKVHRDVRDDIYWCGGCAFWTKDYRQAQTPRWNSRISQHAETR